METRIVWKEITGPRTVVSVLVGAAIATLLLSAAATANRLSAIDDFELGRATLVDLTEADNAVATAALLTLLVFAIAGIGWVFWQWRVATNLESVGRTQLRWSAGWSIGGWLIPVGNYIISGLVLRDLWRSSSPVAATDPGSAPAPGAAPAAARPSDAPVLVITWWITFAVGAVLRSSASFGREGTIEEFRSSEIRDLLGVFLLVAAGVIGIFMINQLTRRTEALRGLGPMIGQSTTGAQPGYVAYGSQMPVGAPAPAGWFHDPSGQHELRYWDGHAWTDQVTSPSASR